jgi:hypothetical protein
MAIHHVNVNVIRPSVFGRAYSVLQIRKISRQYGRCNLDHYAAPRRVARPAVVADMIATWYTVSQEFT